MGLIAYVVLVVALIIAVQAFVNLYLTLYTWDRPDRMEASRGPSTFLPPELSFTVLLPARHEEAVIYRTIKSVWAANYPSELLEVVVICHEDDVGTIDEARRAIKDIGTSRIRVETFSGTRINKPRGLNMGFKRTSAEVVTIFDAEDDVHPDVFNVANTVMLEEGVGVVQAGVQLMNFRDHWFSVHNCLEYYFYYKSRLHLHARVGASFLGGNTHFIRRDLIERAGGWDDTCLTEDVELGLRLGVLGERIRVVYHPQHVTREETPDSASAFIRQRTRWHQGFLQILFRGPWRSLDTMGQKLLAVYTLSYPIYQPLVLLLWPLVVVWTSVTTAPLLVAMLTFLPLYALLLQLLKGIVAAFEFAGEYEIKLSLKDRLLIPVNMTLTLLPFQFMLGYSGFRAIYRQLWRRTNWEKTGHRGAHRRTDITPTMQYELLLDEALERFGAERGSVMMLDPARKAFFMKAARGIPAEVVHSARVNEGERIVGWAARTRRPLIIDGREMPEELSAYLNHPDLRSSIVLPIERKDGAILVFNLSSKRSRLDEDDLRWLNERVSAPPVIPAERPAYAETTGEHGMKLGLRERLLMPVNMTFILLPFRFLLDYNGLRAVYRWLRKKTEHSGAHRGTEVTPATQYELLLEDALDRLGGEGGSVMMLDRLRQRSTYAVKAARELPVEFISSAKVNEGLVRWAARRRHHLIIGEGEVTEELSAYLAQPERLWSALLWQALLATPEELSAYLDQPELRSLVALPIERNDGVTAIFNLVSKRSELGKDDLRWLNERVSALPMIPDEPIERPAYAEAVS